MDAATRQSAALVENSTHATHGMAEQAGLLAEAVARFHLDDGHGDPAVMRRVREIAKGSEPFPDRKGI